MCLDAAVGPVNYVEFYRNCLAAPGGNRAQTKDNTSTGQN